MPSQSALDYDQEGISVHTVGTTTDTTPMMANAATSTNTAPFDYTLWFLNHNSELAGNDSSADEASSGSEESPNQNGTDCWDSPRVESGDEAFELADNSEEDTTSKQSEDFSLSESMPDELENCVAGNRVVKEPHCPPPVAAVDTPQLNDVSVSMPSHEIDQPMDSNGMLWRPLQSEPQMSLRNLGDEIQQFVDTNLSLSEEECADREAFIARLRTILQETISPKCSLRVHGSFVTRLALRESDIDFLVTDYAPMQPIAAIDKMTLALLQFTNDDTPTKVSATDVSVLNRTSGPSPGTYVPRHEGDVFTVQAIVFTRVPIIKITEKRTGIKGDLSFGGGHHDESMRLTRKLLTRFPTARPLLLFLKNIIKDGHMGESAKGGLSSFALYLLVMHFYNIRFHCDGRMWEPTRPSGDTVETGSSYSIAGTPSSLDGAAPRFSSSGGVPNGSSGITAALSGSRLANVGPKIEEFLIGASEPDKAGSVSANGNLAANGTPVPQSIGDESEGIYEEENDPRTLGEVFCLFCWYYSEFEIQTKGIVFDEEGNSYVVQKPEGLRGKATLHMTSPFDTTYDITARMTCIQAFQQLLFLVTVIITAGAKEQSLSLSTLHEQIRECFVDYPEPFDDTAFRIYTKSSMLLAGSYQGRGRGNTRHHTHKPHMSSHNLLSSSNSIISQQSQQQQPHVQQYTYFHTQGAYAPQHYQHMHGYGIQHQGASQQGVQQTHHHLHAHHHQHHQHQQHQHHSQIVGASHPSVQSVSGAGHQFYRDPMPTQLPQGHHAHPLALAGGDKRCPEGRHGTPTMKAPSQHGRSDSNAGVSTHSDGKTDATTSTANSLVPRTVTVTTQTSGHHQQYMQSGLEHGVYGHTPPFFPYSSFPQGGMGYHAPYYGGYPYISQHISQQPQQGPSSVMNATSSTGGSPSSIPVMSNIGFPKAKRGIGKSTFEHPTPVGPATSILGHVHSHDNVPPNPTVQMMGFQGNNIGRGGGSGGRGTGVKGPGARQSPPLNPSHALPIPMTHQSYFNPTAKLEQVMVALPAPQGPSLNAPQQSQQPPAQPTQTQQCHVQTQSSQQQNVPPVVHVSKKAAKKAAAAAAAAASIDAPFSLSQASPSAESTPSTPLAPIIARYVPPCGRKGKSKAGEGSD